MMMHTQRLLRLAFALSLLGGTACGSDAPPSGPGDTDDDGEETGGTGEPSTGDDDQPADDDSTSEEEGEQPAIDAGPGPKRDSGTPAPDTSKKDGGSGGNADGGGGSRGDASSSGPKEDGGGSQGDSSVGPGPGTGAGGGCGPTTTISAAELGNTMKLGPWKPARVERTGPSGSSWVVYPEGFGKDGMKHPVFQWGPGAGTTASNYVDHLSLLASHGFVIISQASTQSGKGALDWILKQNETQGSMWFGKLDPNRVGRGGHSMGALQSMRESDDDRLKMTVLVCGGTMSGRGGGGAANIDYPSIFLGGVGESGTRNFAGDFAEVKGLSVFVTHTSTDHVACARDNMGPWVAFMRWHLCGEEEQWKKEFAPGGTYCKAPWQACMTKMF